MTHQPSPLDHKPSRVLTFEWASSVVGEWGPDCWRNCCSSLLVMMCGCPLDALKLCLPSGLAKRACELFSTTAKSVCLTHECVIPCSGEKKGGGSELESLSIQRCHESLPLVVQHHTQIFRECHAVVLCFSPSQCQSVMRDASEVRDEGEMDSPRACFCMVPGLTLNRLHHSLPRRFGALATPSLVTCTRTALCVFPLAVVSCPNPVC